MNNIDDMDFFSGDELLADPYPYFDALRDECPVRREPHHGVVMVTGFDEVVAIYNDSKTFSSCISVTGPFPGFPVPLEGDDITDVIEEHRDRLPMSDQLPTLDPPVHTDQRALLMRLITPKRLRENEEFMWRLADRQLDTFLGDGRCEYISQFAAPFAMLVIADLLGVPEEDHQRFADALLHGQSGTGAVGSTGKTRAGPHAPGVPLPTVHRVRGGSSEEPPRTTSSRASPPPRSRMDRRPRYWTSSASPQTSSPPGRRPRFGC